MAKKEEKKEYKIVDNKKKKAFSTGSQRDAQEGKGLYDSVPWLAIHRLAVHLEKGAKKYKKWNFMLGQPLTQYYNSAMRHLIKLGTQKEEFQTEDHMAGVLFNVMAFAMTEQRIKEGTLPKELNDIDKLRNLSPQDWMKEE